MDNQTANQQTVSEFVATPPGFRFTCPGAEVIGRSSITGLWILELGVDTNPHMIQIGRFARRDDAKAVARWLTHQPPAVIRATHKIHIASLDL